jgi:hypothetical protein
MTEAEWLAGTDPLPMLAFLGRASERKLRLFACGCCRRASHLLVPEALEALALAEGLAGGQVDAASRKRGREKAFQAGWVLDPSTAHRRGPAKAAVSDALSRRALDAATRVVRRLYNPERDAKTIQAMLLREIFGNPFRPLGINPAVLAWQDRTVVKVAQAACDERLLPSGSLDKDRLWVLADAVEEAGCDDPLILGHLRSDGPHVRGCFVLDALLGKS